MTSVPGGGTTPSTARYQKLCRQDVRIPTAGNSHGSTARTSTRTGTGMAMPPMRTPKPPSLDMPSRHRVRSPKIIRVQVPGYELPSNTKPLPVFMATVGIEPMRAYLYVRAFFLPRSVISADSRPGQNKCFDTGIRYIKDVRQASRFRVPGWTAAPPLPTTLALCEPGIWPTKAS